jgi:hypothetical protein
MIRARQFLTAWLLLTCLNAAPAHAYLNPYVRLGFGGNQQLMHDVNDAIAADVGWASAGGVPVSAHSVGPGYGPAVSAGLWIVPFLRVGATYGQQRASVNHEYRDTGFLFVDDYKFRMKEYGLESAVRIPALAGFTLGGSTAESRGEAEEDFALENVHGNYYETFIAHRKVRTYAVFFGFDQTAPNGVAGFLQVGYHWRDLGSMPGEYQISDNGTNSVDVGQTVPVDYSGWSVRLGAGFDLNW